MKNDKLKVIELFGGIGACSKALERLGISYEIADYVEIDKYAVASFNALHGSNFEPQDIRNWDKDIQADLIMHGSPCQDFSVAGKQAGGDEGSGTRSSLMYETLRIVEKVRPKYVIWENVKNLLSKKHRHNFDAYLEHMESLGYVNYYQVLNAKDYGVPQNRERVFTISIYGGGEFEFPEKQPMTKRLKDVLQQNVDEKFYVNKTDNIIFGEKRVHWDNSGKGYGSQQDRAYYQDGVCPALSSSNASGDKSQVVLLDKTMMDKAIHRVDIAQTVKVRKYDVNIEKLKKTLREHKNYTNVELANLLEQPVTKVEHWFRNDDSFSIPDANIWPDLKFLLDIDTDEFDKSIMEFEERDGVYDKSNRCYLESGIAPTLTNTSADEKIIVKGELDIKGQDQIKRVYGSEGISPTLSTMQGGNRQPKIVEDFYKNRPTREYQNVAPTLRSERTGLKVVEEPFVVASRGRGENNEQHLEPNYSGTTNTLTSVQKDNYVATPYRIRKLTPKECWRLMGFDDEDFEKAEKVNSNTQLYKQAGNSIVVNVLEAIFKNLLLKEKTGIKPKITGGLGVILKEEHKAMAFTDPEIAAAISAFKQAKKGAEEAGCKLVGEFEYRGKNMTMRFQAS